MARPSNTDRLKRLNQELNRSVRWRNNERRDDLWKRMVDLYRCKHYKSLSREDRMVINMAFATKNVIAPSIAVNNPKFVVNARKPESAAQAVITEEVLNYLWRTHKYQEEFRLAVDDFLVMGHVLDLDAMQPYKRAWQAKRAYRKDVERFRRNWAGSEFEGAVETFLDNV